MIEFFCSARPEPQGSSNGYIRKGRIVVTSANRKLKPFRSEVAGCALAALELRGINTPAFGKHVPVGLEITFYFRRPPSVPKKRRQHVVTPDCDKCIRAVNDSLTGIIYHDDAQVIDIHARKLYAEIEGVRIVAREIKTQ